MRRVLYGACLAALLVASPAGAQEKSGATPITVAILLFNQPYITELAGPLDVYHHVPSERLRVFTVSDRERELVTYEGMPLRTNYTIDNAPKIDILVVPSGAGSLDADPRNGRVISWVKEVSRRAKLVTSHCEGAFVLAAAGLLDDKDATTFHTDTDTLQKRYPACRVIKGQRIEWPRFENDSEIMTTGIYRPVDDAARIAVTQLMHWIHADYGLSDLDAYELLSKVGKLHITEMVDPNYVVIAAIDKKYLPPKK